MIHVFFSYYILFHSFSQVLTALVENSSETDTNTNTNTNTNTEQNEIKNKEKDALTTLCQHVKCWSLTRIHQILRYCRDWNTRARNSYISMLTLRAIFSVVPVTKLASTSIQQKTEESMINIPELFAGITPYAERHLDRLDKLYSSSYMIDFVLHSMGKGLEWNDNDDDDDDDESRDLFQKWEMTSKYVLPPNKKEEEKIQLKGIIRKGMIVDEDEKEDEVLTIGESDTESESDDISVDENKATQ